MFGGVFTSLVAPSEPPCWQLCRLLIRGSQVRILPGALVGCGCFAGKNVVHMKKDYGAPCPSDTSLTLTHLPSATPATAASTTGASTYRRFGEGFLWGFGGKHSSPLFPRFLRGQHSNTSDLRISHVLVVYFGLHIRALFQLRRFK